MCHKAFHFYDKNIQVLRQEILKACWEGLTLPMSIFFFPNQNWCNFQHFKQVYSYVPLIKNYQLKSYSH